MIEIPEDRKTALFQNYAGFKGRNAATLETDLQRSEFGHSCQRFSSRFLYPRCVWCKWLSSGNKLLVDLYMPKRETLILGTLWFG